MKHYNFFAITISFAMLFCSTTLAQQSDSIKKIPPANGVRSLKTDIKHIAIDLRFDWQKKQAYGSTTITLVPLNRTDKIILDAGMLKINSATLPDGTALKVNYDGGDKNDGLEIILDRSYQPNEVLTIKIDYNTTWVNEADPNSIWGSFGKGLRFFEPTSTTPNKRKQIWSSGEPEGNRYWFPAYDGLNDLRTTEFTATVENSLMVISNGRLLETRDNKNGTHTFHYKSDTPYPNYLTFFAVGDYIDVKQNHEDIALHTFGYPDEKAAIEATTERLPDMVKYFTGLIGVKYPYPSYTQVVAQDYPFPGLNGQNTAAIVSDNMIDDYRTHADFLYLWDGVESHGLASQWFGNLLTPADWQHIWLNEAFCHYFDGLYTDYKNGHDEYLTYYLKIADMPAVLGDWSSGYRHPIVTQHYDNTAAFAADNYAKIRGSLVLRMLRKEIGEENWWKAIRYYVKTNANKQVTTEDFRSAIEKTTGESIAWFFDQWLYKMGHPVFEITKSYDAAKKQLVLTAKQTQQIDKNDEYPQVAFFKGKVEIEIDGRIEQVWIEPKAENTFTFASSREPKLINFDFENTWIREIKFEKTLDELLYQLQYDKDVLGKWWAMDELVKIAKDEKTPAADKTKIQAALRNTILGKSYWRLRVRALGRLQGMLTQPYDEATIAMLLKVIKNDKPWVVYTALFFLGNTKDPKYANIYINLLNDRSDRVINAAAFALGQSKSPKAFDVLVKLADKPSWKSQSLISALAGLEQLGDPRGFDLAFNALSNTKLPRWWLAIPVWDYPIAAAQTIVTLGKGEAAFPMIFERFKKSMADNDVNDIFQNVLLISMLADPRGQEAFELLKVKYKDDANAMKAVDQYETQFKESIKK